jgi:hypothetical protein
VDVQRAENIGREFLFELIDREINLRNIFIQFAGPHRQANVFKIDVGWFCVGTKLKVVNVLQSYIQSFATATCDVS